MPIKAMIIDDERLARNELKKLLEQHPEIEIIDDNFKSTGEFLKCQVKTTTSDKFYLYVEEKHIEYWNKINMPVIIFLVHLDTENIYWHCVDNIENYTKGKTDYVINFDKADILL